MGKSITIVEFKENTCVVKFKPSFWKMGKKFEISKGLLFAMLKRVGADKFSIKRMKPDELGRYIARKRIDTKRDTNNVRDRAFARMSGMYLREGGSKVFKIIEAGEATCKVWFREYFDITYDTLLVILKKEGADKFSLEGINPDEFRGYVYGQNDRKFLMALY